MLGSTISPEILSTVRQSVMKHTQYYGNANGFLSEKIYKVFK